MKKLLFLILVFFWFTPSNGAFEPKGYGTNYTGSGMTGIASSDIAFDVFLNPAKLSLTQTASFDLFYRNFYGISGLNQITLGSSFKVLNVPVGFGINRFGNSLYAETETRVALAKEFADAISIGVSLNWYHLDIDNYGQAQSLGFDISGFYQISRQFTAAFIVSNLNEPEIGQAREKLPSCFSFGLSYNPTNELNLNIDLVKDNEFDFDYRFGLHYNLFQSVQLLTGFRQVVHSYSGGILMKKNHINIGYALEYHPELGSSNTISFGYEL